MRTSLSKHLNEYVLCRGWIGEWEDFLYNQTRRITILQPTIKKPDKQLLFKDQEVISTATHLNLFVKFEDLINYDTRFFELNEPIHFSGMVEHYTRKDGSNDFGIYATKQSTIVFEVEKLKRAIVDCNTFGDKEFLINYAYNKVQELIESVKSFDDCLPTFHQTYDDLMKSLLDIDETIKKRIEVINYYLDFKPVNREERRALQSKHYRKYIKKHSKKRHTNGF